MAKVKIVDRTCRVCGVVYPATARSNCCTAACRQAAYRQTEKGKASVLRFNAKVKRPDIQKVCRMCKTEFTTARKAQKYCTACSRSDEGMAMRQRDFMIKNPGHKEAYSITSAVVRKFKRRGIGLPCMICSSHENVELHHPDYEQPKLVLPYCRKCHRRLHKKGGKQQWVGSER